MPGHKTNSLPPYVDADPPEWAVDPSGEVQSPAALEKMRRVCRLAATALKLAMDMSKPGEAALHNIDHTVRARNSGMHVFLIV